MSSDEKDKIMGLLQNIATIKETIDKSDYSKKIHP